MNPSLSYKLRKVLNRRTELVALLRDYCTGPRFAAVGRMFEVVRSCDTVISVESEAEDLHSLFPSGCAQMLLHESVADYAVSACEAAAVIDELSIVNSLIV